MPLKQFIGSIKLIINNRHINRVEGVSRHVKWQLRKLFNLFPVDLAISNSKITATGKSCSVSALINSQKMYDFNNMHLIKFLLREGGVFFDIGANIGSYTLIAAEQESAFVCSFEPHPLTFQALKNNIGLNGYRNVQLLNVAVGSKDGHIHLTNVPGSSTNHIELNEGNNTLKIECVRMDNFCKANNIAPDYIKVDVEGFELDVIKSFGDQLPSVKLFFIEINGLSDIRSSGGRQIVEYLNEHGFAGPLSFDFSAMKFSTTLNGTNEDAVFLSKSFLAEMLSSGTFHLAVNAFFPNV